MLDREITDPAGYALQFAVYSDIDAVRDLFGNAAVNERLDRRYRYVSEILEPVAQDDHPYVQHLELGHWIDFFCDDTVSIWRQCAHSRGSALIAPFSHPAVVGAALRVDAGQRFVVKNVTKPLLKQLLRQRVPEYPVRQAKGGSGLPVRRYLESGPLRLEARDALQSDWPMPLRTLRDPHPWLIWNQLTLRMWRDVAGSSMSVDRKLVRYEAESDNGWSLHRR